MPPEAPRHPPDSHGNIGEKRPTPKFASFRPKASLELWSLGEETSTSSGLLLASPTSQGHNSAVKSSHHDRVSNRDRVHGRDEHRQKVERESRAHTKLPDRRSDYHENPTVAFVVDRFGDTKNLAFGALDRYDTPSYSRIGAGNVLGSSTDRKIDRNVSNEKALVLSYRDSLKRINRRSLWRVDDDRRELKIKPQATELPNLDPAANFVSFNVSRRRKRKRGDNGSTSENSTSSGEETTHYRSIEGKARPGSRPSDRHLFYRVDESASDGQEEGLSFPSDEMVQKRRMELSRKIEEEPNNCGAWLDLINHQDKTFGLSKMSKRTGLTDAEKRSNADVKLSMYEKALKNITNWVDRETLLVGMMEETAKFCEIQKLSSRWKIVLENNTGSLKLWTKFLDFKQTSFSSFRYEEVRDLYLECLGILERTPYAARERPAEQEALHENHVYVLLRMTLFMRESGFSEQAAAAWQAVLEYNFFRPDHFERSKRHYDDAQRQEVISSFEDFWDSEVPRIGENGSEGWRSFFTREWEAAQPKTEMIGTLKRRGHLWGSWLELERKHDLLARDPARTVDDIEENDPYRVILFSDIQYFLIESTTSKARRVLLDAFFLFCQLPLCLADDSNVGTKLWRNSGFLRNEALCLPRITRRDWNLQCHAPKAHSLGSVDGEEDVSGLASTALFKLPIAEYQVALDLLFAVTGAWFSAFDTWHNVYGETRGPLRAAWILNALKALVTQGVGADSLAEYSLALELRLTPETAKKTARALLKKQPSNLCLYNAYALIEYRLGNLSRGETTIITSINMGKKLDRLAQQDSILLWRTWIWELLNVGKTTDALSRLLAYGDEQVVNALSEAPLSEARASKPALVLRTERAFMATRDHMLSMGKGTHASLAMECLCLFTYLRNRQSLSAATSVFRSNLDLLSKVSYSTARETFYQSFGRLLLHHATHTHLFKPSEIRSLLAESIAEFPQNTIFLSLYSWNEARFRIDDRVRSIVKNILLAKDNSGGKRQESIIPHFFAIYAELHRSTTLGSNASTIRSTFERAVDSDSGMHCAGLWKLYFCFEHSREEFIKAKAIFWRGVRACPWTKDLYLLAFEGLRDVMGDAELRGIYELLGEKELRVHVGLDEIFEEMDEERRRTSR